MIGENLTNAKKWFDMAVKYDEQKNVSLYEKCLTKAIDYEKKGVEAGETWE